MNYFNSWQRADKKIIGLLASNNSDDQNVSNLQQDQNVGKLQSETGMSVNYIVQPK